MTVDKIRKLIDGNREIEFEYNKCRYSITYYNDNRENYISICKFYSTPIDVKNVDELLKLKIGKYTLSQILEELPDSSFDIF